MGHINGELLPRVVKAFGGADFDRHSSAASCFFRPEFAADPGSASGFGKFFRARAERRDQEGDG
jgi:hypothetical protein